MAHVHTIEKVSFKSRSGGTDSSGELTLPDGDAKAPGLVLIQEWWGLNENLRSFLKRLAHEGFITLAPDLYHGASTKDPAEAERLMKQLNWGRAVDEIGGAAAYLHAHPRCIGQVGVIGFCMGGALTFAAAANVPEVSAAVPFYGIPPEAAKIDVGRIRVPILGHFAERDQWATAESARVVKEQIERGGGSMELHVYDADHAFMNEHRPEVFSPDASKLAWQRTLDFLHKHLG
jgi:carboxymethylenebutenolidase